jgi:hypothetical protein
MQHVPALLTCALAALFACAAPLVAADAHAGHDHAADAHGPAIALGTVTITTTAVAVSAAGAFAAGAEWHLEMVLTPDQPAPKAIRVWVGLENGRGSVKAKAEAEKGAKGEYSAHVEIPKPLPGDSALWIALEAADGTTVKGSLAVPKAADAADHADHTGHQH